MPNSEQRVKSIATVLSQGLSYITTLPMAFSRPPRLRVMSDSLLKTPCVAVLPCLDVSQDQA
jgi:hypothetical protein